MQMLWEPDVKRIETFKNMPEESKQNLDEELHYDSGTILKIERKKYVEPASIYSTYIKKTFFVKVLGGWFIKTRKRSFRNPDEDIILNPTLHKPIQFAEVVLDFEDHNKVGTIIEIYPCEGKMVDILEVGQLYKQFTDFINEYRKDMES